MVFSVACSEKRRRTIDASNNGLVPEGCEKTARQTPEKMGRLTKSMSADCGAGIPLVNHGQGPAEMENGGIRADRLNPHHKVLVSVDVRFTRHLVSNRVNLYTKKNSFLCLRNTACSPCKQKATRFFL